MLSFLFSQIEGVKFQNKIEPECRYYKSGVLWLLYSGKHLTYKLGMNVMFYRRLNWRNKIADWYTPRQLNVLYYILLHFVTPNICYI